MGKVKNMNLQIRTNYGENYAMSILQMYQGNVMSHLILKFFDRSLPTRLRMFAESKQHFLSARQKANEITSSASSQRGSMDSLDSAGTASSGVVNYGADIPPDTISNTSRASSAATLRALQAMVHEMPQYQKEAASYSALVSIVDYCLSACRENLNDICTVEQVRFRKKIQYCSSTRKMTLHDLFT